MIEERYPIAGILEPQTDVRDVLYVPAPGVTVADEIDLMPEVWETENQRAIGMCVGEGITADCESLLKLDGRPMSLSPLALYNMTRKRSGLMGSAGSGVYMRDAFEAARKLGIASEQVYPYDKSQDDLEPPAEVYADAATRRLERYEYVVNQHFDQTVSAAAARIDAALAEGLPVIFGCQVRQSLRGLAGPWQTHNYDMRSPVIGGHCMRIIGRSRAAALWLVQNWWGPDFGDGGFCGLPFAIAQEPFFEAFIVRKFDGIAVPDVPRVALETQTEFCIMARIIPDPAELGRQVYVWIGARLPSGTWAIKAGPHDDAWRTFDGNYVPSLSLTLGDDNPIVPVAFMNLRPFEGAELFVAYGATPFEARLSKVCTIQIPV